jgi:hypothetical protein
MTEHRVFLIGGDDEETATLTETTVEGRCLLSCEYRGMVLEASASDFFKALCDIRLRLEADGLIPFCYGASLNVYPSGMARDMGLGRVGYKLTMGRYARKQDLVSIYAEGPDVIPATVVRQREYFDQWLASERV